MSERTAALGFLSLASLFSSQVAVAETTTGANVALTGGYSTNPFLGSGPASRAAAIGTASFDPYVVVTTPTSRTIASGGIRYTTYSQAFRDQVDFSANLAHSKQLTPVSGVDLTANYSRRTAVALADLTGTSIDPLIPNPDAVETAGQKVEVMGVNAGFHTKFSPRMSLDANAVFDKVNFINGVQSLFAVDRSTYGGTVSAMRAMNGELQIGASVSYFKTDYRNGSFGDGSQIVPSLVATAQITPRLELRGTAGASFSEVDLGVGKIKQTNFSGSISLCRRVPRSSLCATGARSVNPTSFGGISTVTSATANYSYQLTTQSSFTAGVNYSKTDSLQVIGGQNSGYLRGEAMYRRNLKERLSAFINVQYTKPVDSVIFRTSNFYANVGVSYRLGRAK